MPPSVHHQQLTLETPLLVFGASAIELNDPRAIAPTAVRHVKTASAVHVYDLEPVTTRPFDSPPLRGTAVPIDLLHSGVVATVPRRHVQYLPAVAVLDAVFIPPNFYESPFLAHLTAAIPLHDASAPAVTAPRNIHAFTAHSRDDRALHPSTASTPVASPSTTSIIITVAILGTRWDAPELVLSRVTMPLMYVGAVSPGGSLHISAPAAVYADESVPAAARGFQPPALTETRATRRGFDIVAVVTPASRHCQRIPGSAVDDRVLAISQVHEVPRLALSASTIVLDDVSAAALHVHALLAVLVYNLSTECDVSSLPSGKPPLSLVVLAPRYGRHDQAHEHCYQQRLSLHR